MYSYWESVCNQCILRKVKWCALLQVALIAALFTNGTYVGPDLVGGGDCSCILLVQLPSTCTDACPDSLATWAGGICLSINWHEYSSCVHAYMVVFPYSHLYAQCGGTWLCIVVFYVCIASIYVVVMIVTM